MELPQVQTRVILLGGGLDLESPMMSVGEGYALEADNFEPNLNGGYRKMAGFERLDGKLSPSEQAYYTIKVADSSVITVGDTITGGTSGAQAAVVIKDDSLNLLGVALLTPGFAVGETVGTTTVAVPESISNYPDEKTSAAWELAAQDYYRSLIQPVPGTGPVLGVWHWLGKSYAWRSNGSVAVMYESSITGWQAVTLYRLLQWDGGVLAEGGLLEGDTITGATSGATATVKRFVKVSGAYGGSAAGYLVVDVTGAFVDGENIQKGAVTLFTANGADEAIEFALGDNYFDFVNHSFSGDASSYFMYGCDGVNRAFEWDGSVLTPIVTGNAVDAPTLIEAHTNHLFLSFGSSLNNSAPEDPLIFNAILGSAEIAVGETIRSLKSVTGDALLVATDRGVQGLYGQNIDNWTLQIISIDGGDVADTLDVIGSPMMITQRGIQRVDPTDRFGNFESSTVSRRINPLLNNWLSIKTIIGTNIIRDKNQYRIYFSDGSGITLTADQLFGQAQLPQFTTFRRDTFFPSCLASVSKAGGREVVLFGAENGYVYQEEKGNSNDGEAMQYALRLPFHHLGSPAVRKSFKWLDIESDVERTADLRVSYEYSDGAGHTSVSPIQNQEFQGGSRAFWDEGNWSEFNWSDGIISRENLSMTGAGHNVSVLFFGNNATTAPFTINAITYQYLPRRLRR
ncbi:MAG: hypothetical protein RQ714_06550, partial [Nitrosomonas sp.]|nr:hypothetical protein [Nitrosomonas sp.]